MPAVCKTPDTAEAPAKPLRTAGSRACLFNATPATGSAPHWPSLVASCPSAANERHLQPVWQTPFAALPTKSTGPPGGRRRSLTGAFLKQPCGQRAASALRRAARPSRCRPLPPANVRTQARAGEPPTENSTRPRAPTFSPSHAITLSRNHALTLSRATRGSPGCNSGPSPYLPGCPDYWGTSVGRCLTVAALSASGGFP